MKKFWGKHKILKRVLIILLVIILAIGAFVLFNANRNTKAMNQAASEAIQTLVKSYSLTPVETSEFDGMKVYGVMKFDIDQYDIENVGNLCVMRANAGLMQMLTLCITPTDTDMPLLSVDYMYVLGNRTAYVEVYDLPLERTEIYNQTIENFKQVGSDFEMLKDTVPTSDWYDSLRPAGSYKKVSASFDTNLEEMLNAYLDVYTSSSQNLPVLTDEKTLEKAEVLESYTHRLISEGGISTDAIVDAIGEEKTKEMFDYVMFGTKR